MDNYREALQRLRNVSNILCGGSYDEPKSLRDLELEIKIEKLIREALGDKYDRRDLPKETGNVSNAGTKNS